MTSTTFLPFVNFDEGLSPQPICAPVPIIAMAGFPDAFPARGGRFFCCRARGVHGKSCDDACFRDHEVRRQHFNHN